MKMAKRLFRSLDGSGQGSWIKLGLAVAAMSAYILAFFPPFTPEEYRIVELAATPVVVFAWLFGFWGGTAAVVVIIPFNAFLLSLVAEGTFATVMSQLRQDELLPSILLLVLGAVLGGLRDVADQMRRELAVRTEAEEARRESEERYRFVAESASDAILTIDHDRTLLSANRAAEKIFGLSITDMVGQPFRILIPERVREDHDAALRQYLGTEATSHPEYALRIAGLGKGGREIALEISFGENASGDRPVFTGVVRDVTERKQLEQVLSRAKEDAERATVARSEFLSRMSRELRTSLNGILGFGQLLELDDLDSGPQESVAQILKAAHHLLSLIEEVMDMARLEAGRLPLSLEPVPVGDVVETAWELVRPSAERSGIRMANGPAGCDALVMADRRRLQQIMQNLLSNAVKYNSETGTVEVSCGLAADANRMRIAVTDTGQGIPKESMDRLFLPFERLGAEHAGIDNTGIGLALSRGLVEAMGGEIGVESVEGEGSTFWFELPLAESTATAEGDRAGTGRVAIGAMAGRPGPTCTVLYIQDDPATFTLVERILDRRPGTDLVTARHGRQGLEIARDRRPDLILLDLNLPDVHGSEVMRRIREDSLLSRTPVIIIGADIPADQVGQLLEAGAQAFLACPVEEQDLMESVEEALES